MSINQFAGHHHWLDSIVIGIAEGMPYLFIGLVMALWCYLYRPGLRNARLADSVLDSSRLDSSRLYRARQYQQALIAATLAAVLAMAINFAIGQFYYHPRPFALGLGTNLVAHAANTSFPSDHTSFLFAIAFTLLNYGLSRGLNLCLLGLALLGGLARVYTGVHFPFDIVAAIVTAGCASAIVYRAHAYLSPAYAGIIRLSDKLYAALILRA